MIREELQLQSIDSRKEHIDTKSPWNLSKRSKPIGWNRDSEQ